ncbi:MAG: hypothetical protein A2017_20160 [Lentisphaerae bacterium GWF2_44_16]|nr:MAG: hypothetical protein A2017_20160 [Lentisphaerae bacterium GWF2_44_16]
MTDLKKLNEMSEQELARLIEYHNKLYWEKGETEISDTEYDIIFRRLQELNPAHTLLHAVNAPKVSSIGKIKLSRPMLSLDKVYTLQELLTWAAKIARSQDELFLVQPKYDGMSVNFENGVLVTRGKGEEGENITDKLPLIELETKDYKGPVNRAVRGEIIMCYNDFEEFSKDPSAIKTTSGKPFTNRRSVVTGIMSLDSKKNSDKALIEEIAKKKYKLTLIDYDFISYPVKFVDLEKKWPDFLESIKNLPYPMDGLVIKLSDILYSESLGNTAHHPRGQIAFKFSGIKKETKLLDVEWSFGKACLTPVALLEPVKIGGTTIKRVTLHNLQNIIDNDIQIGDTVTVERAGDVIPHIISSIPGKNRKSCVISNCLCCGAKLIQDGPELVCTNPECSEILLQRLLAAVKNIGIENLGEPNIRKMMKNLNVKNLRDIFELNVEKILKLEGFQLKSASNLYKEIQSARRVNDYQLLAAMNIYGIGKNVAKSILAEYTIAELRNLNKEQLSEINGIGPERAEALEIELKSQSVFLDELLKCVELVQTKGGEGQNKPTICFTGKMPKQRSYYENLAVQQDYEPVDTVTSELSLLVTADISGESSKLNKAKSLGVRIISLDEWFQNFKEIKQKEGSVDEDDLSDLPLFNFSNDKG